MRISALSWGFTLMLLGDFSADLSAQVTIESAPFPYSAVVASSLLRDVEGNPWALFVPSDRVPWTQSFTKSNTKSRLSMRSPWNGDAGYQEYVLTVPTSVESDPICSVTSQVKCCPIDGNLQHLLWALTGLPRVTCRMHHRTMWE